MEKKEKEEPWLRLPVSALLDSELSASDAIILAIIVDRADAKSCKLSYSDIAKSSGTSESTVKRAVQVLEARHYISRKQESGGVSEYRQFILSPKKRSGAGKKTKSDLDEELAGELIQEYIRKGYSMKESAEKAYADMHGGINNG